MNRREVGMFTWRQAGQLDDADTSEGEVFCGHCVRVG